MFFSRRTAILRFVLLVAIAASAILTADHLFPGSDFCPLEQACDAAAESPLGSILGVPTAMLGVVAFGGLFLLTLLPVEWARPFLRPAGLISLLAGAGFIAYQATELGRFCPFCLVADAAGILAGLITVTWPTPPIRLSGRRIPGEHGAIRAAWTFAAMAAVAVPLAWPRPEAPKWVEIPPVQLTDLDAIDDPATEPAVAMPPRTDALAPQAAGHAEGPAPVAWRWEPRRTASPAPPVPATHTKPPTPAFAPRAATVRTPTTEPPAPPPARTSPEPEETAKPAPSEAPVEPESTDPKEPAASTEPEPEPVVIVEYLNAYCAHCRATHQRLEKVVAESDIPIRRRRIYAWGSKGYPLWARACAFAHDYGKETALFEELLRARSTRPNEVYKAAQRVGLDIRALQQAVRRPPPARLVRDCRIMVSAGLKGLPTLDIGRRRLMGGQSEADIREAVEAAAATRGETQP